MNDEMRNIFANMPPHRVERRKGQDRKGKIGIILSAIAWTLWGIGMYLLYFAFPQMTTYFDTLYNKSPNLSWSPEYFYISEALWAAGVALCIVSLFQFRKRYRRRSDKRHLGIMTALILNSISIIAFGIFILLNGF